MAAIQHLLAPLAAVLVVVLLGNTNSVVNAHNHGNQTLELRAVEDTTLCDSDTAEDLSNARGDGLYVGVTGQGLRRRALLRFDMSLVEDPEDIVNVTLVLYERSNPRDEPATIAIHRLQQPWAEGNSFFPGGRCAPSSAMDASWNHSRVGNFTRWQTPGGYFNTAASVAKDVGKDKEFYTWTSEGLLRDVRFWATNADQNYGWILIGNEQDLRSVKSFASREAANASDIPHLIIQYTPASDDGNGGGSGSSVRDEVIIVPVVLGILVVAVLVGVLVARNNRRHSPSAGAQRLSENDHPL